MPRFIATVRSPVSPAATFAYLANFASVAEWDPSVTEAEPLGGDGPGEGAKYRVVVRVLGRDTEYEYDTVAFEPSRRLVVRAETDSVVSLDEITFAAVEGGTDVTYDACLQLKGAARLFELPMRAGFRRLALNAKAGLERELAALREEER